MEKALKTAFAAEIAKAWEQENMRKYIVGKTDTIAVLTGGEMFAVEKPSIKTCFCFGYSLSRYDSEDYDRANNMANHAAKSAEYFISENIEQSNIPLFIENITDERYIGYVIPQYCRQPENCKLCDIKFYRDYQIPENPQGRKLTDDDRKIICAALEETLEHFRKRLGTYLQKYGLTKVKTWTYWRDE